MKRLGFIATLGLVTLLLVAAFSLLRLMREPLGPPLELAGAPVEEQVSQAAQAQEGAQNKTCGNSGIMDLLVLGLASPETSGERGADAIRLLRVDFDKPGVGILALPPDLWVNTSGLDEYGVEEATLTQAYWLAQEGEQGTELVRQRKATQALAQVLLDNYDFAVDHYVTVDQGSLVEMVNSLGGVLVDPPYAIEDVPPGWHTFADEPPQLMDGEHVIDYVRLLNVGESGNHPEWERLRRQNQVLLAVCVTALNNWDKLPALVKDYRKLVITDLSVDQILDLNCMLEEVGELADLVVPEQERVTEEDGHLLINADYVHALIEGLVEEFEE